MCFTSYIFCIKIFWNSFYFFIVWLYNFKTGNRWIIHNTREIFYILVTTRSRIPNIIFFTSRCFLHWHRHLSLFHYWSELHFLPSNLHLHSHDICFVNVFHSFVPVIMLNTLRFKSSVLFGTHILFDKLLLLLQLPTHLANLTASG